MNKYFKHYFCDQSRTVTGVSLWQEEQPAGAGFGWFISKCD